MVQGLYLSSASKHLALLQAALEEHPCTAVDPADPPHGLPSWLAPSPWTCLMLLFPALLGSPGSGTWNGVMAGDASAPRRVACSSVGSHQPLLHPDNLFQDDARFCDTELFLQQWLKSPPQHAPTRWSLEECRNLRPSKMEPCPPSSARAGD